MDVDAELEELLASADRGMAVAWHARRRPATPALITPAGTITYGELNERANRLARAFRRRGLRRGDAVALLSSNRTEFVEVLLAGTMSATVPSATRSSFDFKSNPGNGRVFNSAWHSLNTIPTLQR